MSWLIFLFLLSESWHSALSLFWRSRGVLGCTSGFVCHRFNSDRVFSMLTTLHLSIIAAWLSATLDLSQIWQRGRLNTDLGLQLDSVQSLIVTREVGYALSNSLRLFFFWIFVTRPPKAERDTPDARAGTHSGTWNAWGFIGIILRWLTLCLIVSVFTLQVVWRLDSNSDDFPAIYSAESAIEVILSAIFTFKLLLNCFRCTVVSKWICALDYLGFIIPSLFGFGIGIANLVCRKSPFGSILIIPDNTRQIVKFTESILGRFLQGISFYILVLCSLLLVFLPLREPKLRRITPIRLLSPKQPASSFNITTPNVSTPSLSVQPRSDSPMIHRSQSEEPPSTAQITGWLAIQKQGPSDSNDRGVSWVDMIVQLWDQNRAERGPSTWVETPKGSDVFKEVFGYPNSHLGTDPVQPPPIEKPKPEAPRSGMGYTRSATPPSFDLSLSSLEMVDRNPFQVDSPVFGLYGIVQSSNGKSGFRPRVSVTITDSSEGSVISDLIHKQEELDKSIAVLGLLGSPVGPPSSPLSSKRSGIRSAAQSDFSLSNFPDPPWSNHPDSDTLSEPPRSPSPTPTTRPSRLNPPSVSVDNVAFDLVPPQLQIPAPTTEYSLPVSDIADSDVVVPIRKPRSDSQGTQYDVTSFIGSTFFRLIDLAVFLTFLQT